MKNKTEVSVIIPTYNRRHDILRLVKSVSKSKYPKDKFEIIIVDNAGSLSKKDVTSVASGVRIKLVKPKDNLYCSGGCLYGAKTALGDYLFFIDDDNVLDINCIAYLVEGLKNNNRLGIVGPLMLLYKNKQCIWSAGTEIDKFGRPKNVYSNKSLEDIELPEIIEGIHYFPNAFMVKKQVLEKVPFDISNFPHNWSELDFCLRAKQKGYLTATITKALEWHDIDYFGPLTRTNKSNIYDQAKSRILIRKRFLNSIRDWLAFWFIVFPISSIYYLKAILTSDEKHKTSMLSSYLKGTIDGIKGSIDNVGSPAKDPCEKILDIIF